MDFEEIKSIVELMDQKSLTEFELQRDDFKLRIRRGNGGYVAATQEGAPFLLTPPDPSRPPETPAPGEPEKDSPASDVSEIRSPMIGTFYCSPSPEAAPYVSVGSEVEPSTVVCIIEAMKVMNEIKAEKKGVITEILSENAKPVEFGQALFRIRTG